MKQNKWVYNDPRWPSLRRKTFSRDSHLCQNCGKLVLHSVPANHPYKGICDHIVPISKAPEKAFDLDNLECWHKRCHDTFKQRVEKSKRLQRTDGW